MAGIRLQPRDKDLFEAIYSFDGVIAERHARELFYPGISDRAWWARRKKLTDHRYIALIPEEEHRFAVEPILLLDVNGIRQVATERYGDVNIPGPLWEKALEYPTGKKELRLALRRAGVFWVAEYHNWTRLLHHIGVCDLRLIIEKAAEQTQGLRLASWRWVTEGEMRAKTAKVKIRYRDHNGRQAEAETSVYPDGLFGVVRTEPHPRTGELKERGYAYLLEYERGAEKGKHRFVREKILPGVAYLEAKVHLQNLIGVSQGRWLIVTTEGERQVGYMKQAAEAVTNKPYFYFTTLEQITPETFFHQPIWYQLGSKQLVQIPLPIKAGE